MATFVHLRNHSEFSCLEGLLSHEEMAELCRKHSMPAVGVTDVKSIAGAMDFSLVLSKAGIQPLIGCTLSFKSGDCEGPMPLLVKDAEGYRNLLALLRKSKTSLPVEKLSPRDCEGLICLTGGPKGFLSKCLDVIPALQKLFPERLYVEMSRFGGRHALESSFLKVAKEHSIPIVATNDCHFAEKDMYKAHQVLLCIKNGQRIMDNRRELISEEQFFKPPQDMVKLFEDLPEAIENTICIAQRCTFMLEESKPRLPIFSTGGEDQNQILSEKALKGLKRRLKSGNISDSGEYQHRLDHELEVIRSTDFAGYFLIVADFVSWAKGKGVPVGTGRGSGSASIVSWALGITELDPIQFRLIFERFLNPDRVSLPDFDVDFCPEERDQVVNYVREKYGEDKVGHIVTFGRLNARAVIRDVGRALGKPFTLVEKLAKMVPFQPANPLTLEQALERIPLLGEIIKEENLKEMFEIALILEGIPRHESIHAAGIVISDKSLYDEVPVLPMESIEPQNGGGGKEEGEGRLGDMPVIQFDMKDVERAGLVKFDFLGLKTLTVMSKCEEYIKEEKSITLNWDKISFDDKDTYTLMQKGATTGVFQLESVGMQNLLHNLKPDNIEDIMASIALFRPGPMQNIPKYVACKHSATEESIHTLIDTVLKDTYGIIVYQEQVIEIAQKFAGYSAAEADILRRVIGKKKRDEMKFQEKSFVEGATKNNRVPDKKAREVFSLIQKFASYGFNRAHAAGYAIIAYRMCWIKVHHPEVFFAVSLTQDMKDLEKVALFKQDMSSLNASLLPPHVNESKEEFFVENFEKREVRFGLAALKGLSDALAKAIVRERDENGKYKDAFDFVKRIVKREVASNSSDGKNEDEKRRKIINKQSIEILAYAGALDGMGMTREEICCECRKGGEEKGYDILLDAASASISDQVSLFGSNSTFSKEKWHPFKKASLEYKTMSMYFCEHPAEVVRKTLKDIDLYSDLVRKDDLSEGKIIGKIGVVINRLEHKRWSNRHILLLTVSDSSATFYVQVDRDDLVKRVVERMESHEYNLVAFHVVMRITEGRHRIYVEALRWYDSEKNRLESLIQSRFKKGEAAKSVPSKTEKNLSKEPAIANSKGLSQVAELHSIEELEKFVKSRDSDQEISDEFKTKCVKISLKISKSSS